MKKVFTNDMVAHVWAQRSQPCGYTSNRNYSFDGAVLISYHTPIALFCKGTRKRDVCLISSRSFSVSTSRHQSLARRAVHGVPVFYVPQITTGTNSNGSPLSASYVDKKTARAVHKVNLAALVKDYTDQCLRYKRAVTLYSVASQADLIARLHEQAQPAIQYAEMFGLSAPKIRAELDGANIWIYRVEREARLNTPEHQAKLERAREARVAKKEREAEAERVAAYDRMLSRFVEYMQTDVWNGYVMAYEFPTDSVERRYLENAERERNREEGRIALEEFRAWQRGDMPIPKALNQYVNWSDAERSQWQEARDAAKRAELAEYISAWREGRGVDTYRFHSISPMLRLSSDGETVQTSHGAEFPLSHALRAIPYILKVIASGVAWHTNGHTIALGHFQLTSIAADGAVKAGCHLVPGAEILRFIGELTERGLYAPTSQTESA